MDRVLVMSYLARAERLATMIEEEPASGLISSFAQEIQVLLEQALEELAPVGVEQT